MSKLEIRRSDIDTAKKKSEWDFGNRILYDMCTKYPYHNKLDQIVAKVWLIGRSYAVAIERRKNAKKTNDDFYTKIVGPEIFDSGIDQWIAELNNFRTPTLSNIEYILETHGKLTALLKKITGMEKRSLSSKYLHFHKPNLFFIYDSRAMEAIRKRVPPAKNKIPINENIDMEYAKYCLRCMELRDEIKVRYNIHLTPREIDKILLS